MGRRLYSLTRGRSPRINCKIILIGKHHHRWFVRSNSARERERGRNGERQTEMKNCPCASFAIPLHFRNMRTLVGQILEQLDVVGMTGKQVMNGGRFLRVTWNAQNLHSTHVLTCDTACISEIRPQEKCNSRPYSERRVSWGSSEA